MKILTLLFLLALSITCFSQPHYNWIHAFGESDGNVEIIQVTKASENSIIAVGTFTSAQLSFPNDINIVNHGTTDIFMVKIDTSGTVQWAKAIGGTDRDYVGAVACDTEGNIVIVGNTKSSSVAINQDSYSNAWPYMIFVAKLNKDGNVSWFKKSTGSTFNFQNRACDIDAGGNIYFSGTYFNTILFDGIQLENPEDLMLGFVGKLDKNGSVQWIRSLSDDKNYYPFGLKANSQAVYVSGKYTLSAPTWDEKLFVSKYNSDSLHQWTYVDTMAVEGNDVALTSTGDVCVLGKTYYMEMSLCNTSSKPNNTMNLLFLDESGNLKNRYDTEGAYANDFYIGENDTLFLTGDFFANNFQMGSKTLTRTADSSNNCAYYPDIFVAKMNTSGDVYNVFEINGSLDDIGESVIAFDSMLYIAGTYESYHLNFGDELIVNDNELSVFMHVSGTYYDRLKYSFIAAINHNKEKGGNTSSASNQLAREVLVYPNPSNGKVSIQLSSGFSGVSFVNIYNLKGQQVYKTQFIGNTTLDLSSLDKGIYLLEIIQENNSIKSKLILSE